MLLPLAAHCLRCRLFAPVGSEVKHSVEKSSACREIGIYEKQSSLFFSAKSCHNRIDGNVGFNGPRAFINLNDGESTPSLQSAFGLVTALVRARRIRWEHYNRPQQHLEHVSREWRPR